MTITPPANQEGCPKSEGLGPTVDAAGSSATGRSGSSLAAVGYPKEDRAQLIAVLIRAASCQGGHSEEGYHIARTLGVRFPLNMPDLIAFARNKGENPADIWPWMIAMGERPRGKHRFFTAAEIARAKAGNPVVPDEAQGPPNAEELAPPTVGQKPFNHGCEGAKP